MSILQPIPYTVTENQDFSGETIIKIVATSFIGVDFIDGRIAISFVKCRFKKIRIENSEIIDFKDISIQFVDCYIEEIKVENIISQNISIHFGSSIIDFAILNNANIKYVGINNCFFGSSIFLINVQKVNISYTEENIFAKRWQKLFNKLGTNFQRLLQEKCSFDIYDCKEITFHFNENDNKNRQGLVLSSLNNSGQNSLNYYLTLEDKRRLNISLNLNYTPSIEHTITKITNGMFSSLQISGNCKGGIEIENSKIDELYLRNFSVVDEGVFFAIKPKNLDRNDTKLEIHKCNLDKVTFDNFSFSKYSSISLYRNKFGQTTNFISCDFPDSYEDFEKIITIENIHYPDRKDDNYYKARYETFLQLKKVVENSGNFYEAQKFQMVSNHALKQIDSIPLQDKLILWVNSFSNNHGLSISRPFIGLIVCSVIFYIMYLLTLGKEFNCNSSIDWKLVGYYFSFLDITHRTDFLVKSKELSGSSLAIDYINKAVIGFFTYQFVASFRKYGRK